MVESRDKNFQKVEEEEPDNWYFGENPEKIKKRQLQVRMAIIERWKQ